jgi:hypothetical protein
MGYRLETPEDASASVTRVAAGIGKRVSGFDCESSKCWTSHPKNGNCRVNMEIHIHFFLSRIVHCGFLLEIEATI